MTIFLGRCLRTTSIPYWPSLVQSFEKSLSVSGGMLDNLQAWRFGVKMLRWNLLDRGWRRWGCQEGISLGKSTMRLNRSGNHLRCSQHGAIGVLRQWDVNWWPCQSDWMGKRRKHPSAKPSDLEGENSPPVVSYSELMQTSLLAKFPTFEILFEEPEDVKTTLSLLPGPDDWVGPLPHFVVGPQLL